MALRIVIDPYLLCLPDPCHSQERLEVFVNGLLGWSQCLDRDSVQVFVSGTCIQGLFDDNEYPYQHRLRDLLKRFSVDVADHETVCQLVSSLLNRTPTLEDACEVQALFDRPNVVVSPVLCIDRLPDYASAAYLDALVILTVREVLGPPCHDLLAIASVVENADDMVATEMLVRAQVEDLQWHTPTWDKPSTLPVEVSEHFEMAFSYDNHLRRVDVLSLWGTAESEEGALDAIRQEVAALIDAGAGQPGDVSNYRLGNRFLESARNWGFGTRPDYARTLIESCARIIIGRPKNDLEPFRVNAKQGSQQRTRQDGALAFRTHLTKKGASFRLMLWTTVQDLIEFANVGDKDELEIY